MSSKMPTPREITPTEKSDLERQLPHIGSRIKKTITSKAADRESDKKTAVGTVIYVNLERLWYLVEFQDGFRECYKLPEVS